MMSYKRGVLSFDVSYIYSYSYYWSSEVMKRCTTIGTPAEGQWKKCEWLLTQAEYLIRIAERTTTDCLQNPLN